MTKKSEKKNPQTDGFTTLNGERYYRIAGYDRMEPFFMSVPSDTDLWMFVSSRGGLTAGRVDADRSLFPYETVDKLHDAHHHSGPVTLVRAGRSKPWQPFSARQGQSGDFERSLYKNTTCNRLVFEETNNELALRFRYRWSACDEFGIVRTATLDNLGANAIDVSLLDGLRNVLPYGARLSLHQQSSSLIDAYRRVDLDAASGLAVFSLSAAIIDRAEAAEMLRANTVWCRGLEEYDIHLAIETIDAFRAGEALPSEDVLTGRRGNFLVTSSFSIPGGGSREWHIVADAGKSHIDIAALIAKLTADKDITGSLTQGLETARDNLRNNVGSADGIQVTGNETTAVHHFANVLFNNMRGGVFDDNYSIPKSDFIDFLHARNRPAAERQSALVDGFGPTITLPDLLRMAEDTGDADFQRLCLEYLPLYFGRRHGDPSRPWNRFSITVKKPNGDRALSYEGNWRDIFQNWQALGLSFPEFIPSFIAKFVNASTVDGFNPYRITRDGIDWEIVEPDDPWSYIGYWGDHQIIYLLRFLESLERLSPASIERLLQREIFSYADVPYRIKPFADILRDPRSTIDFDTSSANETEERVDKIGADGKLVRGADGSVYHVTLLEKLIVPVLAKLSNLVLDGGIWMNTQRPEWNDANNALVGSGVSMVTLYYLRRHILFVERCAAALENRSVPVSSEVVDWLQKTLSILADNQRLIDAAKIDDAERMEFLSNLGMAFSDYRRDVYANGFSGKTDLPADDVKSLCVSALGFLDRAIHANRRADGLYHAYNLLEISDDGKKASVSPLYEMLEGQVAALSSGLLDADEAARVLTALFESDMYREDQKSFMLYPERSLPSYFDKNRITEEHVSAISLFRELLDAGDSSVIARDAAGAYRFNGDFQNSKDVDAVLDRLAGNERWTDAVARDRERVLGCFEDTFQHKSFTGRSGTMYGYEGLGCIYWHMVAKLLVAVQENVLRGALSRGRDEAVTKLIDFYFRIRDGLGFRKTAAEYGAFPTDPYSHTPKHAGARQPGMTGQVKEEILSRFGELGVRVNDGIVSFEPLLLAEEEFLKESTSYACFDLNDRPRSVELPAGSLAFSFCQTPIVYELTDNDAWIRVTDDRGTTEFSDGNRLSIEHSRALFARTGQITVIRVGVPVGSIRRPASGR